MEKNMDNATEIGLVHVFQCTRIVTYSPRFFV